MIVYIGIFFYIQDISLSDFNVPKRGKDKQSNPYEEIVEEHVKEMIERAKELISGNLNILYQIGISYGICIARKNNMDLQSTS